MSARIAVTDDDSEIQMTADVAGHRRRGGESVTSCALDEADFVSRVGLVEMLRNAYIGAS